MSRPEVGDVFLIPVDERRARVGQVVGVFEKRCFYFAVFEQVVFGCIGLSDALDALKTKTSLLALSMDGKIHAGHWRILGQAPVDRRIPMPAYKGARASGDGYDVVDFSGSRRRRATPLEAEVLPFRTVVAPVRLEHAVKALAGLEPWSQKSDDLVIREGISSADLFGS